MQLDLDCAVLCYSCYFNTEVFDKVLTRDNVWIGIKKEPTIGTIIACRGSTTLEDWHRDFKANMIADPILGWVEKGFIEGIHDTVEDIVKLGLPTPFIITGHSLGAAHAALIAALLTQEGYFVSDLVLFGCPRPGSQTVKDEVSHLNIRSYRNSDDPVTKVPFTTAEDPYVDVAPFIDIKSEPIPGDMWFLLKGHHIQSYITSLCINV